MKWLDHLGMWRILAAVLEDYKDGNVFNSSDCELGTG